MKAKYFKRIRAKSKWIDVVHSSRMFGGWFDFDDSIRVLAYNAIHACERAKRRGYGLGHDSNSVLDSNMFAHFCVKLTRKSKHWKNITFVGN